MILPSLGPWPISLVASPSRVVAPGPPPTPSWLTGLSGHGYRRRTRNPFSQDQETGAWRLGRRLAGSRPGSPAAPGARPDAGEPARPAADRPHGHRLPELEVISGTT